MLRSDFALRQNQARSRDERKADDLPPLYGIMLMIIWITIRRPVLLKCHQTEAAGELEKDDNSPVHRARAWLRASDIDTTDGRWTQSHGF